MNDILDVEKYILNERRRKCDDGIIMWNGQV